MTEQTPDITSLPKPRFNLKTLKTVAIATTVAAVAVVVAWKLNGSVEDAVSEAPFDITTA